MNVEVRRVIFQMVMGACLLGITNSALAATRHPRVFSRLWNLEIEKEHAYVVGSNAMFAHNHSEKVADVAARISSALQKPGLKRLIANSPRLQAGLIAAEKLGYKIGLKGELFFDQTPFESMHVDVGPDMGFWVREKSAKRRTPEQLALMLEHELGDIFAHLAGIDLIHDHDLFYAGRSCRSPIVLRKRRGSNGSLQFCVKT